MKKLAMAFFALALVLTAAGPAHAARVVVGVGVGGYYPGYPGYYGYPGYGYPGYYPYYVAPPPVVYAVPPSPPPVAAPVAYGAVPPAGGPPVAANQTSPTFIDGQGRTCRHFEATSGNAPPYGTACLMPDGSWRSVP